MQLKRCCVSVDSWSIEDKKRLLLALQEHGTYSIQIIAQYLPEKSISELRYIIEKYKKLGYQKWHANDILRVEDSPLNQWVKLLKRMKVNSKGVQAIIPRVLKYIALYEKRTKPNPIKLRDCYLVLSQMAKGEACKNLDAPTSFFFYDCLTKLAQSVRDGNKDESLKFIKNITTFEPILRSQLIKSYNRKQQDECFPINPLKVPDEFLRIQKEK